MQFQRISVPPTHLLIVDAILHDNLAQGIIDDPLLKYAVSAGAQGEKTVNFSPLFAAQGAVGDAVAADNASDSLFSVRLWNAEAVTAVASSSGWKPHRPHQSLRGGIVLLQPQSEENRSASSQSLRARFHESNVALTAYEQGWIRLSMPAAQLVPTELGWLQAALQRAS